MVKSAIPIYAAEMKDSIVIDNKVSYAQLVTHSPEKLIEHEITTRLMDATWAAIGGESNSFDLYPINTILVTTGKNRNDDIFTTQDTWAARLTPEDKPFNIEHEPRQIIGHITANVVMDDDLNIFADDAPFDNIPDKFHILTSGVVYKHLNSRDETLAAESAELITSIQNGEWFVSMECLFGGFDYGITHASGEFQTIQRTPTTAFLTKHLRIHGGCGEYNGGKLGRVLRHITFSGKGLVKNPANLESVIFNDTERFVEVVASGLLNVPLQQELNLSNTIDILGEPAMADETKYTSQLEDQNKGLQTDLAAANERIEKLGEAQVKSALAEKDVTIVTLQSEAKIAQTKIEELTASYNESKKAQETTEAAKAEVDTKLAEATTELVAAKSSETTANRVAMLVDKGVDKADAETVAAEFIDLDDDKFATVVAMKSEAVQAAQAAKKDNKDEEKKKDAKASEESDPDGEAAADEVNLDSATPDTDPAMASEESTTEKDELMTSLASFLDSAIHDK